jgi:hypothetical protein
MSDSDLLMKMAAEVARIGAVVDELSHQLKDNGQPGIISRFRTVENIQRECQQRHKEEREAVKEAKREALLTADANLKKSVAFATLVGTVVSTALTIVFNFRGFL